MLDRVLSQAWPQARYLVGHLWGEQGLVEGEQMPSGFGCRISADNSSRGRGRVPRSPWKPCRNVPQVRRISTSGRLRRLYLSRCCTWGSPISIRVLLSRQQYFLFTPVRQYERFTNRALRLVNRPSD